VTDGELRPAEKKQAEITTAFTYSSKCIAALTRHRHSCKLKPPNEMEHENEE
jgi:hypothetical protein